jgi:hypothetical protein
MDAPLFRPLALPAGASRRRLEVFSPKLARRLSLTSYDAWRCWLVLEANPAVSMFCERPARINGPTSSTLDFWVATRDQPAGEFWLIVDDQHESSSTSSAADLPQHVLGLALRPITTTLLAELAIPLANWAQILPFLVSFRDHRQAVLEQSIVVELASWTTLGAVLKRFAEHDSAAVQASLFWLVAGGRVLSPDLATAPLTRATRFRRR